jgi:hypothetical protein
MLLSTYFSVGKQSLQQWLHAFFFCIFFVIFCGFVTCEILQEMGLKVLAVRDWGTYRQSVARCTVLKGSCGVTDTLVHLLTERRFTQTEHTHTRVTICYNRGVQPIKRDICHHAMAIPQVADGGAGVYR